MDDIPLGESGPVTDLLRRWRDGDPLARDHLIPLVYGELRRGAHFRRRGLLFRPGRHALLADRASGPDGVLLL